MLWLPFVSLVVMGQGEVPEVVPTGAPAAVQASAPNLTDPVTLDDVEVRGRRGVARVPAETELDGAEIDALGVYDIGEVIRRLTEDYALGDAPMIIVNGRRMADPSVFSAFSPDALVRAEILPPEAGGIYGATDPSQRVVNIVLQRRFDSLDGRASASRPTAGGMTEVAADLRRSSIIELGTRNLRLQADVDTALRADERRQSGVRETGDEVVTLRPANEAFSLSLARTGTLGDWAGSLNAEARTQKTHTVSRREGDTIESRRRSRSLMATGGLTGDVAGWSVRATLSGQISHTDQSGLSPSDTRRQLISAEVGLNRILFELPTGAATANLSGRASRSNSVNEGPGRRQVFSGRMGDLNGNLSIPLARRDADEVWIPLPGDITLALGGNLTETDAGRGGGLSAGLVWTPARKLRMNASWSTSTQSLSDEQRFAPEYYGEPTTVFDFRTGEAVEVLPIMGGNPDLRPPSSDRISLSVSTGPFTAWNLQGGVSMQRAEGMDGIGVLLDPTPEAEAAFPERFQRDADGRLISIDLRPINLNSTFAETLTSNINFRAPFGRSVRWAGQAPFLQFGINHSWQLTNVATFYAGLPELDRLAGDGGGMSRHLVSTRVDGRLGNWGLNATANWRSASRVRRESGRNGPDDLVRADFTTIDLKLTYLLEPRAPQEEGARSRRYDGIRLELEVDNLLDARPEASLGDGSPAPGYGRNDRDPVGRVVRVTASRRF